MSIFVRIFEFRMGIGIEKSDKFQFVNQYVALGRCLRDSGIDDKEIDKSAFWGISYLKYLPL